MKRKLMTVLSVTILLPLSFLVGTVFSPPAVSIPPLFNVFVTNTSADPVPVDVTDATLDVTLDDAVEVTNPAGESLKADVSGWLHTTQENSSGLVWVAAGGPVRFYSIETKGFREITVKFFVWEGADAEFEVLFETSSSSGGSASFIVDQFTVSSSSVSGHIETYSVQGSEMIFRARSLDAVDSTRVILWYYMTT